MDTRTTLLAALPLVLIITVLAAVLLVSANPNFNLDFRPKASTPIPTIAPVRPFASPTSGLTPGNAQLSPEVACSDLYSPVCGKDGITYESICDANNHNAPISYYSACNSTLPVAQ